MFHLFRHNRAIRQAYQCYDQLEYAQAADHFRRACRLIPSSWEAHFGLGVTAKWLCDWNESIQASRRAAKLREDFEGAWWNIGIAATALGFWREDCEAWNKAGVKLEISDAPLAMKLGRVPIRLKTTNNEVVWCDRLDPARAKIISVPTADSLHRCGDLLLTDGEPSGSRWNGDCDVPVFNELQILQASNLGLFTVLVEHASNVDIDALVQLRSDELKIEDWSTIRRLCRQCSEGRPHDHHDQNHRLSSEIQPTRQIAFAAASEESVRKTLAAWSTPDRVTISSVECPVQAQVLL